MFLEREAGPRVIFKIYNSSVSNAVSRVCFSPNTIASVRAAVLLSRRRSRPRDEADSERSDSDAEEGIDWTGVDERTHARTKRRLSVSSRRRETMMMGRRGVSRMGALWAVVLTCGLALSGAVGVRGDDQATCLERTETVALDAELDTGTWQLVVPAGLALFGGDVAENETLGPWSLGVPKTDAYGCTNDGVGTTFEKDVLVVTRGECEFYQKALVAQALGAKGLLIVSPGEDFTTMTCNEATKLDVVTALVTGATGQAIVDAIGEVTAPTITLARADALPRPFDFLASTALVAIAMLTIYLGGLWSLKDKRYAHSPRREDSAEINTSDADEGAQDGIEINEYTAFYFVIIASAVLLILFYSMQHWIFVVMRLVFAFASFQGLHVIIFESLIAYRKTAPRDSQVLLPLIGNVHFLSIPAAFGAGLITATWLIFQGARWSWILQDIMGLSFLVNVLRLVHLPNLKVATILLCCAMLYDIFWVYIQPHLFGDKSVMVTVARGGERGENLPMLFLVPRLNSVGDFSMLGYGDVILPGLLIVHNLLFDNRKRGFSDIKYYYFFWSMVAYAVGMCLTFAALYFEVGGQGGQPALTYLVPMVVGTSGFLSWKHGDLGEMWNGVDEEYTSSESQSIL